MEILDWTSIWLILCSSILIFNSAKLYIQNKALADLFLCISVVVLLGTNIMYLVNDELELYARWGNILASTFIVSSVFSLIRDSKPVFARFPIYLVYLPFLTLIFYPLVMNTAVISNIVLATFQAGAIITGLMIYILKQTMGERFIFRIISVLILAIAFLLYWLPIDLSFNKQVVTELLLGIATLFFSYDIYKQEFKKIDNED